MATNYVLSVKQFAGFADPDFDGGVFSEVADAVRYFMDRAQIIVGRKKELGDFICWVIHPGRKQVLEVFRVVKKEGGVIIHAPNCGCEGCQRMVHIGSRAEAMAEALADAETAL
jgi:hypothetical protein